MNRDPATHVSRRERSTLTRRRKATVAAAAAIVVTTPAMAAAVIERPPAPPLEVVVFPERDFVVTEGGPGNTPLNFQIIRNGVVIGSSAGTTDVDGLLEVNHPGGVCWQGVTPNILPGDRLLVTEQANPDNGYEVLTQDIHATSTEILANGTTVEVRGVALNPNGTAMTLNRIEQRIINPDFREPPFPMEKRDIRATVDDGNLRRDPSVVGGFIATHTLAQPAQAEKAMEGQTRVLGWMATNAAGDRMGITIWEEDELGGPGFGGCPTRQDYAVTAFNQPAIKRGTRGLTVSGTANDATAVRITLVDGAAATPDPSRLATLSAGAPKTFKAAFTARQLRKLRDGRIRAVGTYTVNDTPITGVVKTVLKDLRAPKPATSDTRSGAYRGAQSVVLSHPGEPRTSRIFYTTNGRLPRLSSLRFRRAIRITSTKTLRAVVVDQAGNRSVSNCKTGKGCWRIKIR